MELLSGVVAGTAQDFWLQVLQCAINPFTAGSLHPLLARRAPSIRSRIVGVVSRPEEADPLAAHETLGNMLAHKSSLLPAMNVTLNFSHPVPPANTMPRPACNIKRSEHPIIELLVRDDNLVAGTASWPLYSTFTSAALIIGHHLAISAFCQSPSASGVN